MSSLNKKIRLEDGSKISVHLDTGAKMYIMAREVIKDARLAMRKVLNWSLYLIQAIAHHF